MGLLDKNFKSDISSNNELIKEECLQYFELNGEFELNINSNSLILNTNKSHNSVYIDLDDLNYIRKKFPFLTHLYIDSDLCISVSDKSENIFADTPFHIHVDESVKIRNYSALISEIDLLNISFECKEFRPDHDTNIKNIELKTQYINTPIRNNINQIFQINGKIKTDIVVFRPDTLDILANISIISEPLSKLFSPLFYPRQGIEKEDITTLEYINPIKLLGIGYYNAISYNFIVNRRVLAFTKKITDKNVKNYIKMADGWYAVFAEMR